MAKYTISIKQLSRDYGFDESSIRKNWVKTGLNLSSTENEIRTWIVQNILNPLRETDIREQIDRARLEKMQAEAELAKIEVQRALEQIIDIDLLESELGQYLNNIKNMIRSIPNQNFLELFESQSANELKSLLQEKIDEKLLEIGNMKYEEIIKTGDSTEPSDPEHKTADTQKTE
ncbi:hypothetical protein NMD63_05620 [Edwardsiella tarda]|uniref:hypothetical protein n=1 Tax=Edwardsiella tarda TaxID=636 RepID=UPI00351C1EAF